MQSRARTVIPPDKKQPSAFKSLCLPNTDFMVDFLGFFTRNDFENFLQLTCKRMNMLILTHFASKPYRYLDNVTLMCNLNVNMELCLKKQTTRNSWDNQWDHVWIHRVGFSKIRQFLDKTVRVPKVVIWITDSTVIKQENIDELKSLSHIWENAQVEFTTFSYLKKNLMSCGELLSVSKLFRCRRFKCSYNYVMLPLWEYPEIYSLEAIDINFKTIEGDEFDLKSIIELVENQALYPHSQTTFVFSEAKYRFASLFTNTVLWHIRNKFMESEKAQSFRIVFAVKERFKLSNDEMNEFRLENNRTQEVLHILHVTYNEVAKYCEFNAKTKYCILERSLV